MEFLCLQHPGKEYSYCNYNKPMKTRFLKKIPGECGFALVVTLTLMVLLAILALGLLSLSSVALRSSGIQSDTATARANARMALSLAIAELQKHAGPDQRVTARADLLDASSPNPAWTGVWNSRGGQPAYLVSGNEHSSIDLASLPTSHPAGYRKPDTVLVRRQLQLPPDDN